MNNKLSSSLKNFVNAVVIAWELVFWPAILTTLTSSCGGIEATSNEIEKPKAWFTKFDTSATMKKWNEIGVTRTEISIGKNTVVKCMPWSIIDYVSLNGSSIVIPSNISTQELVEWKHYSLYVRAILDGGREWLAVSGSCEIWVLETEIPEINKFKETVNVFWWVSAVIEKSTLKVWETVVAVWPDECSALCVILDDSWQTIWSIIPWKSVLLPENWKTIKLTVTNKEWWKTEQTINLMNEAIYGLENYNPNLEIGQEVNLVEWLTFSSWIELEKIEIKYADWTVDVVASPRLYKWTKIWPVTITFYLSNKEYNWEWTETKNVDVLPEVYVPYSLQHYPTTKLLKEKGLDKIEQWDWLEPSEKLRIRECSALWEYLWENGTPSFSPLEYRKKTETLEVHMLWEIPENYTGIMLWDDVDNQASKHGTEEWWIFFSINPNANLNVIHTGNTYYNYLELGKKANEDPSKNHIAWQSIVWQSTTSYEEFQSWTVPSCDAKNLYIWQSWGNKKYYKGKRLTLACHWTHRPLNEHCFYTNACKSSFSNGIRGTFSSNYKWNVICDDDSHIGSNIPLYFPNWLAWSWRTIPYKTIEWKTVTESSDSNNQYEASYVNWWNVAEMTLLYHLDPTVNIEELENRMMKTALYDTISYNWTIQELPLINPKWYVEEFLLPELPSSVTFNPNDSVYYFDIWDKLYCGMFWEWMEIWNGEVWVECKNKNWSEIDVIDPKNAKYRLNKNLLKKYWVGPSSTIDLRCWPVITKDGQLWWLNIGKETTIVVNMEWDNVSEFNSDQSNTLLHVDDEKLTYNGDAHDDINISPIYIGAPADESQMFDSIEEKNSYTTQIDYENNPISYTEVTDAIHTGYNSRVVEKNAPKWHWKNISVVYNNQEKAHKLTVKKNYPENLLSVFRTSNNVDNHDASFSLEIGEYARNLIDAISLNSEERWSWPSIIYNHPVNIRRKDGRQGTAMAKI